MAKQAAKQSISKYWKGKVTSDFSLVKSHFKISQLSSFLLTRLLQYSVVLSLLSYIAVLDFYGMAHLEFARKFSSQKSQKRESRSCICMYVSYILYMLSIEGYYIWMRTLARYDWSKTHVLSEYKPAILYCSSTKP